MSTGLNQTVVTEICKLARKYHLQKVILFGSRARGDFHRASDIDLAVSGGNILRFSLDIEEETSTLLTFDVIDLDRSLDSALLNEIKKDGILLYEKI